MFYHDNWKLCYLYYLLFKNTYKTLCSSTTTIGNYVTFIIYCSRTRPKHYVLPRQFEIMLPSLFTVQEHIQNIMSVSYTHLTLPTMAVV